jgi:hypothetical protein
MNRHRPAAASSPVTLTGGANAGFDHVPNVSRLIKIVVL